MVNMQRAQKPSNGKTIEFAITEESLESELVYWIRDLLRKNGELVHGLERIRHSHRELRGGEPDTDCEVALRQVEQALRVAEELSLLGLAWFREQNKT
jgi:hypothetical protein